MNQVVEFHPFDEAVALGGEPRKRQGRVSAGYQNMVGPFGGVTAAKILNAVLMHPESSGTPTTLTVNFLGPIKGKDIEIIPVMVRQNRSNQHWTVEMWQADDLVCTASLIFATRSETWAGEELTCPEAPAPENVPSLPEFPMAPWVNRYDLRYIHGSPFDPHSADPDSESAPANRSESLLWMRDLPERPLDFLSLTALSDAFFPRLFVRKKKFAPVGTVTFTVYFHSREADLAALTSSFVLGHARASKFSNGYFDQSAEIWSAEKTLLATTHQLVYYKD